MHHKVSISFGSLLFPEQKSNTTLKESDTVRKRWRIRLHVNFLFPESSSMAMTLLYDFFFIKFSSVFMLRNPTDVQNLLQWLPKAALFHPFSISHSSFSLFKCSEEGIFDSLFLNHCWTMKSVCDFFSVFLVLQTSCALDIWRRFSTWSWRSVTFWIAWVKRFMSIAFTEKSLSISDVGLLQFIASKINLVCELVHEGCRLSGNVLHP